MKVIVEASRILFYPFLPDDTDISDPKIATEVASLGYIYVLSEKSSPRFGGVSLNMVATGFWTEEEWGQINAAMLAAYRCADALIKRDS